MNPAPHSRSYRLASLSPPSELRIKEAESTFRTIFNSTFEYMGILSPDGVLLNANQVSLDFIHATLKDVAGKYFWETPWWNYSITSQRKLKQAIQKAKTGKLVRFEVELRGLNDKIVTVDFSLKPLKDNVGNVILLIAEGRDITERKNLDELRKELLSSAAHELKTPLTVLKLMTQSHIKKAQANGVDVINISELERINNELDRLTGIINDLLDSSRFELGKLSFQFRVVNVITLIRTLAHEAKIFAKDHTIRLSTLPDTLEVIADPVRIEQVLLNLLSNAVKYSPASTMITLAAEQDGNYALVKVQDQGQGIPKSRQKLIFDKYYQVKSKSPTGFGLGLYISNEIIKRHKGKLRVTSRKGRGSTFSFTLPLAQPHLL